MRNTTQIEDALKDLILKDDKEFVAMLSGEWGIGKTYFWEKFQEKNLSNIKKTSYLKKVTNCIFKNKTNDFKSTVYISLFGYSSIQNLKNDIVLKLSKTEQGKAILNDVFQNLRTSLGSREGDESSNISLSGSLVGSALSLIPEKSLAGSTICFDDFERLSDKIDFKDVMGLISQFKEQKKCKVIMILNEGELSESNQEVFSKNKEKIVDYNFHYQPIQEELFQAIKEDIDKITFCDSQTIYTFFKKIGLKNIRIMKQALYLLREFSFIESEGYDKKVIDEFVEIALNLFVFKAKSNYTYLEFIDFKLYTPPELLKKAAELFNSSTEEDLKETKNERHEKNLEYYFQNDHDYLNKVYHSINTDLIEKNIYTFIDTHKPNKDELKNLLNENNQSLSWYNVRNKISEMNTRFFADFSTSNHALAKQLFELVRKHKDDMHRLFHYNKYKPFIEKINEFAPEILTEEFKNEIAKEYLNFYILNPEYDKYGPIDSDSQSDLIVKDYKWAKEYREQYKKDTLQTDPKEVMSLIESVLSNRYLSEDITYKLNQISAKDYENLIKENSDFILPLIKFLKMPDSKDIRTNIINALKSLKGESKDYAWKVNQIAESANIDLEEDK